MRKLFVTLILWALASVACAQSSLSFSVLSSVTGMTAGYGAVFPNTAPGFPWKAYVNMDHGGQAFLLSVETVPDGDPTHGWTGYGIDVDDDGSGPTIIQGFSVSGLSYSYSYQGSNLPGGGGGTFTDRGVLVFTPAVPEPQTYALLLLGLVLFAWRRASKATNLRANRVRFERQGQPI